MSFTMLCIMLWFSTMNISCVQPWADHSKQCKSGMSLFCSYSKKCNLKSKTQKLNCTVITLKRVTTQRSLSVKNCWAGSEVQGSKFTFWHIRWTVTASMTVTTLTIEGNWPHCFSLSLSKAALPFHSFTLVKDGVAVNNYKPGYC